VRLGIFASLIMWSQQILHDPAGLSESVFVAEL
jgi:hypothetical protein